ATVTSRAHATAQYITQAVLRHDLVQSVTASGTVNPQNTISVGTQASGTISQLYVDYNSKVKAGQVLARIDPSTFQAQLDQAQASLMQAQAQAAEAAANADASTSGIAVARANSNAQSAAADAAETNIAKAKAALRLAAQQSARDETLLQQGYVPESTVQSDRSAVDQDESALAAAQAFYAQAQAQAAASNATVGQNGSSAAAQASSAQAAQSAVEVARANVEQDQVNLAHTVITSPVDGTVVSRAISVGQTVAASFNTPTLFAIAQDLNKMQVDINVGEPDIGNVKKGDAVGFSVLAYPNETFRGTVSQVRINPQTLNNVVTYDVVVLVNNGSNKLLPGMTANATIDVAKAGNALIVPAGALEFHPAAGSLRGHRTSARSQSNGTSAASPWGQVTANGAPANAAVTAGSSGSLWIEDNGALRHVRVTVLLTNATDAAVSPIRGTLNVGDRVVVATGGDAVNSPSHQTGSPLNGNQAQMRGATRGIH
ncbi:MAG: efflux RND transporter periplasmic adaptor subunit, partial [Candidatus Eremiobacteraeota bacterium]|nr:efflux RND transporter periplasmic adaptor subunit [Candidatus Eremiobacteraeota bacterium]